ncbi:MAG: hypothetical protein DWB45_07510 [Xanthomonadales bacterium]|nr:hypothetical protein [Xanthomonadales bacterium]MDL1868044.1 hypothetical protein [Gammaproteobacteria bacterium PRO6]
MRHGSRLPGPASDARRRIAAAAARLISESGLRDYRAARDKAAAQLGIRDRASLPDAREIDAALREHQRLFGGERHEQCLQRLREHACEALRLFAAHEPRLVGAVLDGSADAHSAVCLHLHTERPLEVSNLLAERGIAWSESARRLRLDRDTVREFPSLRFDVDGTTIDLTLLPFDLLRQAPLDRTSDQPMRRATLAAVEALLAAADMGAAR